MSKKVLESELDHMWSMPSDYRESRHYASYRTICPQCGGIFSSGDIHYCTDCGCVLTPADRYISSNEDD